MAVLVYTDAADGVERSVNITAEPILIGRNPECTIRSTDGRVSRMHARLYCDHTGTTYIEDLGSSNGVYVGQNKVMHSAIPIGEYVVVGSLTFRIFEGTGQVAMPPQQQYGGYAAPPPAPYTPAHGVPQPGMQQHGMQQHGMYANDAHTAPAAFPPQPGDQYGQYGMPPPQAAPPAMPPPQAAPPAMPPPVAPAAPQGGGDPAIAHLLEAERKARMSAEEERDAYGARMAELHKELRELRDGHAQQHAASGGKDAELQALRQELQGLRAGIASKDAELQGLRAGIASKDAELQSLRAGMGGKGQELQALAAAKDKELSSLRAAKDQEIASLRTAKDQEIASLRTANAKELQTLRDAQAKERRALEEGHAKALADAQAKAAAAAKPAPHIETLAIELESTREKLTDATDQLKSAEARLKSAEDELSVARQDVMAAEDRIISEVAAAESRAAAELQSRVEELEVTRADLIKSEERVLEMSRKIGELQERLARLGVEDT